MASSRFRIELAARVALAAGTAYLFMYLLVETGFAATTALVGALSVLQCALLAMRLDRRNRALAHFFKAINDSDFGQASSIPEAGSPGTLGVEYRKAMATLKRYRLEEERRDQYLEMIAKGIGIGFAVFDAEGRIDYANEAFKAAIGPRAPDGASRSAAGGGGPGSAFMSMKNGATELIAPGGWDDGPRLLATARDFVLMQRKFRLVSIQDIRRELEANEMDAWQKLARVLTHEIMNSIAPISSLAFSANSILAKLFGQDVPQGRELSESERDAMNALEAIGARSRSLLFFVENYRKLLRVPTPSRSSFPCAELLGEVDGLMGGVLREKGIGFKAYAEPRGLRLHADKELVEQALINLIKNSIDALQGVGGTPAIEVRAYADAAGRAAIEVADNGPGIPEALLEKIFVPFFTTKGEGSGIGLSLCRQIMRLHGGSVGVKSPPGGGAAFTLRF